MSALGKLYNQNFNGSYMNDEVQIFLWFENFQSNNNINISTYHFIAFPLSEIHYVHCNIIYNQGKQKSDCFENVLTREKY